MYLSKLRLWNFRKYGTDGVIDPKKPHFEVSFKKGLNVLVGENDAGKTTVVDAIRYVLKTQSGEFIQIEEKDFFQSADATRAVEMRIECEFADLSESDCGLFWEWLSYGDDGTYSLRVSLTARRKDNDIQVFHVAGDAQTRMDGDARRLLRPVYLKPLRDALMDMTHGYKSRLGQILGAHKLFQEQHDESGQVRPHDLENLYGKLKKDVDDYFAIQGGKEITEDINTFLREHFLLNGDQRKASIRLTAGELSEVLRQLDLILEGNKSGLGTLNLLCMSAELLLMSSQEVGLKLAIVEELEAHLHPQYQLRLINYVKNKADDEQFILTTHSNTLASSVPLDCMIVVHDKQTYPMSFKYTKMNRADYRFMERFLDATKSNLFFARGVILVEGDAENILIPAIASIIDLPLHKYGVSIINVGSTAYERYVNMFQRNSEPLKIPIAVVTDLDVRSIDFYRDKGQNKSVWRIDEKFKEDILKITDQIDLDKFPDVLHSIREIEIAIQSCRKEHFPKTFKQTQQEILQLFTEERRTTITEEDIEGIRSKRHERLKTLQKQYVKYFAPKEWTLEYDIARGALARELYQARLLAAYEKTKNFQTIENEIDLLNKFANQVVEEYPNEYIMTAHDSYDIFAPLNEGLVSKAITAQYLAEIILKGKETYAEKIIKDQYLSYIVDAIRYVTNPRG